MQTNFFKLDILSPVHIGTGDELDPMSYLMRREEGKMACYVLDIHAWAADYPDPDELEKVFSAGNVPNIRGFLAAKIDPAIYGLRRITVSSERIYREYERKLSDQSTSNQLLFSPHMTTSDRVPMIPGSSLKGAIRTAVIDWLDREKNLGLKSARAEDYRGNAYRKRLESVLGPITESAFKQLKTSDLTGYADSTILVEPLEVRLKEGKSPTPKNKCEAMPSLLTGGGNHSRLYTRIALGSRGKASGGHLILRDGKKLNWFELADLVNSYSLKRFQAEKSKFYGRPNFSRARTAMEKLESELRCVEGQMVLRLGHYSQIEFVTVEKNQPFTRKGRGGKPMPYGTTRTLSNGRFPFGWVRLTPCREEEYLEGTAACEASNRDSQDRRETRREKVLLEKKRQLDQKRQHEAEERRQAEEDARRQAELNALPEEKRQLLLLKQGVLNENQVVALYNELDSMEPQLQLRTATALKDYWQKAGKWKKKNCSKKQVIKVRNIKNILGET